MGAFLAALPFALWLIVIAAGFTALHLEALRHHRARTADRQASSFVWRA